MRDIQTHPLLEQWNGIAEQPKRDVLSTNSPWPTQSLHHDDSPAPASQDPNDYEMMKILNAAQRRGEQLFTGEAAPQSSAVAAFFAAADTSQQPPKGLPYEGRQPKHASSPGSQPLLSNRPASITAAAASITKQGRPQSLEPQDGLESSTLRSASPDKPLAGLRYPLSSTPSQSVGARGAAGTLTPGSASATDQTRARKTRAWTEYASQ